MSPGDWDTADRTTQGERTAQSSVESECKGKQAQDDGRPSVVAEYQWAELLEEGDVVAVAEYSQINGEPAVAVSTGGPRWAIKLPEFTQPLAHDHFVHAHLATSDRLELTDLSLDARTATVVPEDRAIEPCTVTVVPPTEYATAEITPLDTEKQKQAAREMETAVPFRVTDLTRVDAETVVITAERGEYETTFSLTHRLRAAPAESELATLVDAVSGGDIEQLANTSPVAVTAAETAETTTGRNLVLSDDENWLLALDRDPYEEPVWPVSHQATVQTPAADEDTGAGKTPTIGRRISAEDRTTIATVVALAFAFDMVFVGFPFLVFCIVAVLVYVVPLYLVLGWTGSQY